MTIALLIIQIERLGLLTALAFLATRLPAFRRLITGHAANAERLKVGLVFGLFGILGTYTGVVVRPGGIDWAALVGGPLLPEEAIANTRAVSVIVGGLLGGPWTGLTAGLVAGGHRLWVGGFTGPACAVATCLQGLCSGLLHRARRGSLSSWRVFAVGLALEAMQMLIILLLARPFPAAVALVLLIAGPMILANSAGIALFLLISRAILGAEAALQGDAARKALAIATKTLPILGQGLTPASANAAAKVIRAVTGMTAVALTDTERILAHVGVGDDHHLTGAALLTQITRQAIQEDRLQVAEERRAIECQKPDCPLQGVVVVPLHEQRRVVGTLKLYFDPVRSRIPIELAEGLAYHFSTQLALARAQQQAALLDKAEIRALQAQIQPHFLFNALNTVMALIRVDAEKARQTLGHLADFLRRNLRSTQQELVPLAQELEHVRHYLAVEQARFGDRLRVSYDVPPEALSLRLPPLSLQPLVENAIVHGLKTVKRPWYITLSAELAGERAEIHLYDNGQGIDPERLAVLLDRPAESQGMRSGLALHNVHERLQGLFGDEAGLSIASRTGEGTTVTVHLPVRSVREEGGDADSGTGGR